MQPQSIDFVTRALFHVLPQYLQPYVEDRLREQGIEDTWELVFTEKDRSNGRRGRTYTLTDPAVQLKLLFFEVARHPLIPTSPDVAAQARNVLRLRNTFAHPSGPISPAQAATVLNAVRTLFELLGFDAAVEEIEDLLGHLRRLQATDETAADEGTPGEETSAEQDGAGSPPAEGATEVAKPEQASEQPDTEGLEPDAEDDGESDLSVPTASDISNVPQSQRSETETALDSLTVELGTELPEILASSAFHRPQLPVRIRLSGATTELPILRISTGLMVDTTRLTLENDQVVTLGAGESVEVVARLALDRTALMGIDQVADAQVEVVLSASGSKRTIRPDEGACRVFGTRNWRLARDEAPEVTLPAFVQPQQPVLAELLREAGEILAAQTGSSSLNAYQESSDRTDAIVDAVARAVHARGITYANPPAAWAESTQRIRSAEEVLTERLGTCLDTTVLLASLFEQAGIEAQLWLLRGHIFVGYWREERLASLGDVNLRPELASNEIDKGDLRLLETTALTEPEYLGLDELHRAAHRAAGGPGAPAVHTVIDVPGARKAGIYPLPVRALGADGEVTQVEYAVQQRDLAKLVRENLPGTARQARRDTDVPPRIDAWKKELLDLSLRNRLINLTPRAAYSLAVPEEVQGAFEDMLHAGSKFTLAPDGGLSNHQAGRRVGYGTELDPPILAERLVDDHRVTINIDEDNYTRALQKLASTARTVVEETGSNNLYLTLGTLHWSTDGRDLVSPLVLIPMTITAKARGTKYEIALDETGSSTPNHSLLQRLAHELELTIPGLEDPETDDAGIDLDRAFRAVRNALTEHQLPFRVETRAYLGLFDFGGFRLWKDLDENWGSVVKNPLVHHLVHQPAEPFDDPAEEAPDRDLDQLVAQLPTTADASQARVVAEAVAGRTIVVEGPPGTGKSQTITNLIVQAMVEGKRVLFVAEKQAALEVVSRRLAAAGVSDLVLNLHDVSLKPTAVKAKIRSALDLKASFDEEGLEVDRRALEARRQELIHYRDALHTKNPARLSLYSAHTRGLAVGSDIPALDVPPRVIPGLDGESLQAARAGVEEVGQAARAVEARANHPWRLYDGALSAGIEGQLVDVLLALRDTVLSTPTQHRAMVEALDSPEEGEAITGLLSHQGLPWQLMEEVSQPRWEQAVSRVIGELAQFRAAPVHAFSVYQQDVITGPLDQVRADLSEARTAFFGRRGKMRRALAPLARWELPGTSVPDDMIEQAINELLDVRDRSMRLVQMIATIPGLPAGMPPTAVFDPRAEEFVLGRIAQLRSARDARAALRDRALAEASGRMPETQREQLATHLRAVTGLWRRAIEIAGRQWTVPVRSRPLPRLIEALASGTAEELTPRGMALWMNLERAVEPLRHMGLDSTARQILDGTVDRSNLPQAFDKGLAQASFRERVEEGNLRSFDGETHDRLIDGFDTLSQRVREGARAAIRSRILAHREAHSTRTSKRQASDLRREVGGRARAPKIRPLITRYGDVISRAMPCVLVSPESAARFIPLGEPMFDIVVFDEASQITVPAAVGAMGRGRSVVVVGDSRQMPPTRFAQLTSAVVEDDTDAESVPDEESILGECVAARVERHWLSNHYRSRTEELIAFSNERYYESRLATFPGPQAAARPDIEELPVGQPRPGVRMRRVEGTFLRDEAPRKMRRTNPIEADAIVDEVLARFQNADDDPSIGIVTFNMQQRDLIETRLRERGGEDVLESLEDPDGLFVKNLENVQGDERDTIFFSVAFSPNSRGEVPLNFGPLNREGGERRLNVAVTRAREEVVVFSSFDPAQLHAERSTSVGLQHLRDYLDLAARGVSTLASGSGQAGAVDRHRDDVADALRARGLQVRTSMGLSDFRVDLGVGPEDGDLVLAVMLDGAAWANRATTDDRELLPRAVLTGVAGWPAVERVWLLDWIERREKVLDRLVERVERTVAELSGDEVPDLPADEPDAPGEDLASPAGESDHPREVPPAPLGSDGARSQQAPWEAGDDFDVWSIPGADHGSPGAPAAQNEQVEAEPTPTPKQDLPAKQDLLDRQSELLRSLEKARQREETLDARDPHAVARYREWNAPFKATIEDLEGAATDPDQAEMMTRLLVSAVAAEYPLSSDRAARLVIGSLGMKKVRSSRIESLWQVVDRNRVHIDDDGFVWPISVAPEEFTGYRAGVLRKLTIDDLHPRELRNVMTEKAADILPTHRDNVLRAVLERLGGTRLTEHIRRVLLRAYHDVLAVRQAAQPGEDHETREPQDRAASYRSLSGAASQGASVTAGPGTAGPREPAPARRRGRPRIDPVQEMQEIVEAREHGTALAKAGSVEGALEELTAVSERLTKRQARLRKAGRDGDAQSAAQARTTQFLRGEVFGEMAELARSAGDTDSALYFHGRAANDGFGPSLELLADMDEADGRVGSAVFRRMAAQQGVFPWEVYPSAGDTDS